MLSQQTSKHLAFNICTAFLHTEGYDCDTMLLWCIPHHERPTHIYMCVYVYLYICIYLYFNICLHIYVCVCVTFGHTAEQWWWINLKILLNTSMNKHQTIFSENTLFGTMQYFTHVIIYKMDRKKKKTTTIT